MSRYAVSSLLLTGLVGSLSLSACKEVAAANTAIAAASASSPDCTAASDASGSCGSPTTAANASATATVASADKSVPSPATASAGARSFAPGTDRGGKLVARADDDPAAGKDAADPKKRHHRRHGPGGPGGPGEGDPAAFAAKIFALLDKDHDGALTREEFMAPPPDGDHHHPEGAPEDPAAGDAASAEHKARHEARRAQHEAERGAAFDAAATVKGSDATAPKTLSLDEFTAVMKAEHERHKAAHAAKDAPPAAP